MNQFQLEQIKHSIFTLKGHPVSLYAVGERNRLIKAEGILDGAYSDIFTVLVKMSGYHQRFSYSYREILMHKVKVTPLLLKEKR